MTNQAKLSKIINGKTSTWQAEAKWRRENEYWLSNSFSIAALVLDTLARKAMTQKDLAEKMRVKPQFINKIVKGQENLSLETIGKLEMALGTKLMEIAARKSSTMKLRR